MTSRLMGWRSYEHTEVLTYFYEVDIECLHNSKISIRIPVYKVLSHKALRTIELYTAHMLVTDAGARTVLVRAGEE